MKKIVCILMLSSFSSAFAMNSNSSVNKAIILGNLKLLMYEAKSCITSQVALGLIYKSCAHQFPITEYGVQEKLIKLDFLDDKYQVHEEVCKIAQANFSPNYTE